MAIDSEFRIYPYIDKVLADLGWNTNNPAGARGGSVYTQGEFRSHSPLLAEALGRKTPENIILIPWDGGFRYWVVEAKANHRNITRALNEAQDYADRINAIDSGAARFATGIAGTLDDSFYVTTTYWNGHQWSEVEINNYETTGFLSLEQCEYILRDNNHSSARFDDDPDRFLKKANDINKTLHSNEVPVGDRASIMASLLLALAQDANLKIHADPQRLIREINGLIEDLLREHSKEDFAKVIQLRPPATKKNYKKFRKAIIETLQHLREMNIRSAINGDDDALGKFYETFLKYANGAKEMGVVLTPRHITRFAVDVVGVGPKDRIFDPACGTGGFLVSAMEAMRQQNPRQQYEKFKNNNLFGVEQRDDVYGLAVVNMIFRGDGKSHVYDGNCFEHEFWLREGEVSYTMPGEPRPDGARKPFTRVLMNPPFKLIDYPESQFIDHALRQMRRGGILFAVLPAVVISGIRYKGWRQELLKRHTVKACIKLDKNLFYPVAEATYGLILEAHTPHEEGASVFMGILFDDHHRPRKSKMLSEHESVDNVEHMTQEVRRFLLGEPVERLLPREQCVATLGHREDFAFAPEKYISGDAVSINAGHRAVDSDAANSRTMLPKAPSVLKQRADLFTLEPFIEDKPLPLMRESAKHYPHGFVPVVSASYQNNGIQSWKNVPEDECVDHCITISTTHNTRPCEAFWHPYKFAALKGAVYVLKPSPEMLKLPLAILYLCESITANNAWRYNYACTVVLDELEIWAPIKRKGVPDLEAMADIVKHQIS